MGVRIVFEREQDNAVLYDSVTETAFGTLFHGDDETSKDAQECADHFLAWLDRHENKDARTYTHVELEEVILRWEAAPDRFGWEYRADRLVDVEP